MRDEGKPETRNLKPLFHDNHLLACDKPAGLLTQPSGSDRENLEDRAKAWVKAEYDKPGKVFLEAVHRLDAAASGVVLFARTSKALSRLNAMQRAREITKRYEALVEGRPREEEGQLEHWLRHGDRRAVVELAGPSGAGDRQEDAKGAKEARLTYRIVDSNKRVTRVVIELETGRYHQIRAQFAAIGCPILGDTKYGSRTRLDEGVIALHHREMSFVHPVRKEPVRIKAPVPRAWETLVG